MNFRLVSLAALATTLLHAALPSHAHLSHDDTAEHQPLPVAAPAPIATRLAQARGLVDEFRQTGNDAALKQAAALMGTSTTVADAPVELLTTRAAVEQAMHRFESALELLDRALLLEPGDTQARLLRASIHRVRGDRVGAAADCRAIRSSEVILRLACLSAAARGGEESQRAYATINALIKTLGNSPTRGLGMWIHSIAGDLAADLGSGDAAIAHYEDALGMLERSQVRAALADQLLAKRRFEDALRVIEAGSDALPLRIRRFIAAKHLGQLDACQTDIERTRQAFERLMQSNDYLHAREMARFYLDVVDDKALAAQLALKNIGIQREPEDIALLHRTGQSLQPAAKPFSPGRTARLSFAQSGPPFARHTTARRPGTDWLPGS